jgi:hypothetical protein
MARRNVPIADNPKDALADLLSDLHDIYYVWYEKASQRHYWMWLTTTIIGLLSGFATSIIAALATEESLRGFAIIRILLVVLPAVGASASTIAVQSRLHERHRLRENGREGVQCLWNEGRGKYAAAKCPDDYTIIYNNLVERLSVIEKGQAVEFFSFAHLKLDSEPRS